jgi:hypothetical protein
MQPYLISAIHPSPSLPSRPPRVTYKLLQQSVALRSSPSTNHVTPPRHMTHGGGSGQSLNLPSIPSSRQSCANLRMLCTTPYLVSLVYLCQTTRRHHSPKNQSLLLHDAVSHELPWFCVWRPWNLTSLTKASHFIVETLVHSLHLVFFRKVYLHATSHRKHIFSEKGQAGRSLTRPNSFTTWYSII